MSSCLVLQQKNSLFIASDTAVSSIFNGKRIRVSNKGEKLFKKDNALIFCSGKMTIATDCKKYIEGMENLSIDAIQEFVSCLSIDGLFEVFIGIIENGTVKTYQLSSYNDFKPVERALLSGQTEIFALGFNTENMLNDFESYLGKTDVIDSIKNTFNNNICTEVGGNLDIMYYYNGLTYQSSHSLKDSTLCLVDILNEENHHLVIADTLIGRMILGQELYISNEDVSVAIRDNGLTVRDKVGRDKAFLGLDAEQNPEFKLGTKEDKTHLIWDKNGLDIKADRIMIGSEDVITGSNLEQTAESILLEVRNVEDRVNSKIEMTANTIRLEVSDEVQKLNSSITLTNEKIETKVDKDGIISSINQTAERIKISASKIDLQGYVTITNLAENGTTTINGSNIKTGVIKSVDGSIWLDLNEGKMVYYENGTFLGASNRIYDNWTRTYGLGMLANTESFVALATAMNDYATVYAPELVIVAKDIKRYDTGEIRYRRGINCRADVHMVNLDVFYMEVDHLVVKTKASTFLNGARHTVPIAVNKSIEHFGSGTLENHYCRVSLPIGFFHSGYIVTISPLSSGAYRVKKYDEYFEVTGDIENFDYIIKGIM